MLTGRQLLVIGDESSQESQPLEIIRYFLIHTPSNNVFHNGAHYNRMPYPISFAHRSAALSHLARHPNCDPAEFVVHEVVYRLVETIEQHLSDLDLEYIESARKFDETVAQCIRDTRSVHPYMVYLCALVQPWEDENTHLIKQLGLSPEYVQPCGPRFLVVRNDDVLATLRLSGLHYKYVINMNTKEVVLGYYKK